MFDSFREKLAQMSELISIASSAGNFFSKEDKCSQKDCSKSYDKSLNSNSDLDSNSNLKSDSSYSHNENSKNKSVSSKTKSGEDCKAKKNFELEER